jgi:shikimate dehydrogenase
MEAQPSRRRTIINQKLSITSPFGRRFVSSPAVQPLLALLARPVGGNPTQYVIERTIAHHELDWRYLTFEVGPENLADAIRGLRALGFRGAHLAAPHKQAVIPFLDSTAETAGAIGVVNLVRREENALVGENTEGRGVVQAIRAVVDPAGKQVVLLGAGKLARAAAVELAGAGVAGLTIVNRTEPRAAELAETLRAKFSVPVSAVAWQGDYAVPPEAEILIHATPLGHGAGGDGLPLAADSLRPELLVADAAAIAAKTWLLDQAIARGCKTVDGLSVFIEQVAIGLQLWTGVEPNRQIMREAVEEFLCL